MDTSTEQDTKPRHTRTPFRYLHPLRPDHPTHCAPYATHSQPRPRPIRDFASSLPALAHHPHPPPQNRMHGLKRNARISKTKYRVLLTVSGDANAARAKTGLGRVWLAWQGRRALGSLGGGWRAKRRSGMRQHSWLVSCLPPWILPPSKTRNQGIPEHLFATSTHYAQTAQRTAPRMPHTASPDQDLYVTANGSAPHTVSAPPHRRDPTITGRPRIHAHAPTVTASSIVSGDANTARCRRFG